jgi:hypothetical protein
MAARDQEEQDLRIDQMTVNIEKMRAEMKWESRKFVISTVVAAAALAGAGVAIGNWIGRQQAAAPIYPPGTVITIPPAKS